MSAQPRSPDPVDVHVGARIRARRGEIGISQEALALQLGVSFQQVQKYERGLNRISASMMWRACTALACTPNWLFEGLPSALDLSEESDVDASVRTTAASADGRNMLMALSVLDGDAREALFGVAAILVRAGESAQPGEGRA